MFSGVRFFVVSVYNDANQMEDWVSGLNQRFTKPPAGKTAREFESNILRKFQNPNKA